MNKRFDQRKENRSAGTERCFLKVVRKPIQTVACIPKEYKTHCNSVVVDVYMVCFV